MDGRQLRGSRCRITTRCSFAATAQGLTQQVYVLHRALQRLNDDVFPYWTVMGWALRLKIVPALLTSSGAIPCR